MLASQKCVLAMPHVSLLAHTCALTTFSFGTTATRVEQQHVGGVMNFQDPEDVLKADLEKQSKPKNIKIDPTKT